MHTKIKRGRGFGYWAYQLQCLNKILNNRRVSDGHITSLRVIGNDEISHDKHNDIIL